MHRFPDDSHKPAFVGTLSWVFIVIGGLAMLRKNLAGIAFIFPLSPAIRAEFVPPAAPNRAEEVLF